MALSDKRQIFIAEYLTCWNATEAARRAGYAYPNVEGTRLLANASIAEEIKSRVAERAMTADEVLTRLAEQGRAEYSRYFRTNGTVDLAAMIADGKGHLIKSIKETKYGKNVEFYDAHSARELIGRHHRLFESGPTGKEDDPYHVKHTIVKGYTTVTPDDWDETETDSDL